MSADEEVGDHAIASTAGPPVLAPGPPGAERIARLHRHEGHPENVEGVRRGPVVGERRCDLRPHDIARDHGTGIPGRPQRVTGRWAEASVSREDIEKDARVNRGDHGTSAGPRS